MKDSQLKTRARKKRKLRVRRKIRGTSRRPRLSVFRSLKHLYAQVIDDEKEVTLAAVSTLSPRFREKNLKSGGNLRAAAVLGELLAESALALSIKEVVFDRSGYRYHGRVKALAEAVRRSGLKI